MDKTAWFITHDDYVDRRIFFFTDIMEEQGYQIKLFPYWYANVLSHKDPKFVLRPVSKEKICQFGLSSDHLLPEEKEIFEKIINQRKKYKEGKVYYVFKKRNGKQSARATAEVRGGILIITYFSNEYLIIYNSYTNAYSKITRNRQWSYFQKSEEAIYKFMSMKGVEDNKIYNFDTIQVVQSIVGEKKFLYANDTEMDNLYIFDRHRAEVFSHVPLPSEITVDEINGRTFDFTEFKRRIYNYTPIFHRIKKELQNEIPNVVYVADLPTLPIGIILKELTGCKLIIDCHEWWYKQTELWEADDTKKLKLVEKYEAELYPKCDIRITVGENLAKRMREVYRCEFEVIYSCMSQKMCQYDNRDKQFLLQKYGLPRGSKIAIFQGGMSTFRNLENLARATKYLDEDSFLLLLTSGIYQDTFKRILKKEGNPDRVIWGGWLSQDQLLSYTQNADVGVIPYTAVNDYSECFVPNKLMEYFQVQVPIFYDASMLELDLVAGGNQVGYGANLKNVEIFGTELNRLLHDDCELGRLRSNYLKCQNNFTSESQKRIFEDILSKM